MTKLNSDDEIKVYEGEYYISLGVMNNLTHVLIINRKDGKVLFSLEASVFESIVHQYYDAVYEDALDHMGVLH